VNKNKPLVSIIIPTYNRAHLIGETLDSVLAQTYPNWECIVVDDGSTDRTKEVVQAYVAKDTRFKYVQRPEERCKGANACRNYGFEISKGTFVNWFDDDDVMLPEFIEKKTAMIERNQLDGIISKTALFDSDLDKLLGRENRTFLSANLLEDFAALRTSWYICDVLWRKQFLNQKPLFNEQLKAGQDRDFHIRMLLAAPKLEVLDAYLTQYRKHPDNLTSQIDDIEKGVDLRISHMQSISALTDEIDKHGKLSKELKIIYFNSLIKYLPFVYKDQQGKNLLIGLLKKLSFTHKTILLGWLKFYLAYLSLVLTGKGQRILK
jgi:glycosyltransferase involved in cell wall biosynthesis